MKIVDVNEFYADQGGGVKTYVNAKLRAAADAGHEMVVIAPGREDREERRHGGRVLWVKGPAMPFDPRYTVLLRRAEVHRLLDRERPDVIEGSSPWTGGWFASSYRGAGFKSLIYHQDPVAVYPHTFLDRVVPLGWIDQACTPYWIFIRNLARRYDMTMVAGEWLQQRLTGCGVPRVRTVPFGIDRSLFSPQRRDPELRRRWLEECGLGAEGHLLVTISRHHPEKRLGTLIDAVRRLEAPVGLVLFGDGPMRRRVERWAQSCSRVHVAGFVSDRELMARTLASADALLHGSAAETFGYVMAEALCSGLPLVVPNRGGALDFAAPEVAESFVPGRSADCAAAIRRLLARERSQLSQSAVALAERLVRAPEDHFGALFDVYEQGVRAARS